MDNLKSTYREGEETTKETLRKADGDESLADKIGDAGDDVRKEAGNLGDDLRRGADDMGDDARRNTRGDSDLDDRAGDRKSTRLNSSHTVISYAVFCLKKKTRPSKKNHHKSNLAA